MPDGTTASPKKKEAWQPAVERLREVAIPIARRTHEGLSARTVRRHEATSGHCRGFNDRTGLDYRGRTDNGVGCHHASGGYDAIDGVVPKTANGSYFNHHDLSLLSQTTDKVMVMYSGSVIEIGRHRQNNKITAPSLYARIIGITGGTRRRRPLSSNSRQHAVFIGHPFGCPFHPRCTHAKARCQSETPALLHIIQATPWPVISALISPPQTRHDRPATRQKCCQTFPLRRAIRRH